jgi:hypothetical protein
MVKSERLPATSAGEREALLNAVCVGGIHFGGATEAAPSLGVFGLAQVPPARAGAQDFAAGCDLEPLGGGLLGLNAFWTSHKLFLSKRARNIGGAAQRIKSYFQKDWILADSGFVVNRNA